MEKSCLTCRFNVICVICDDDFSEYEASKDCDDTPPRQDGGCEPCKFDPKSRYYDAGGIETQDIIKAKLTPEQYEGWCLGNIIAYACRYNFKDQKQRDVEKIGFYQKFMHHETPSPR